MNLMSKTEFGRDSHSRNINSINMSNSMKIKSKSIDNLLNINNNESNDLNQKRELGKNESENENENKTKRPSILAMMSKNNSQNSLKSDIVEKENKVNTSNQRQSHENSHIVETNFKIDGHFDRSLNNEENVVNSENLNCNNSNN